MNNSTMSSQQQPTISKRSISSTIANLWTKTTLPKTSDKIKDFEMNDDLKDEEMKDINVENGDNIVDLLETASSESRPAHLIVSPKQRLMLLKYKQMLRQGKLDKLVELLNENINSSNNGVKLEEDAKVSNLDDKYKVLKKSTKSNKLNKNKNSKNSKKEQIGFSYQPVDFQYDLSEYDTISKDCGVSSTIETNNTVGSNSSGLFAKSSSRKGSIVSKTNGKSSTSRFATNSFPNNSLTENQIELLNGKYSQGQKAQFSSNGSLEQDAERDLSIVKIAPIAQGEDDGEQGSLLSQPGNSFLKQQSSLGSKTVVEPTVAFDFIKKSEKNNYTNPAPLSLLSTSSSSDTPSKKPTFQFTNAFSSNKTTDSVETSTPNKFSFKLNGDANTNKTNLLDEEQKKRKKLTIEDIVDEGDDWERNRKRKQPTSSTSTTTSSSAQVPLFEFDTSASSGKKEKEGTKKPAFSFGLGASNGTNTAEKKDGQAKPAFSFGLGADDKKEETDKPAFSFGASTGTTDTEKKDDSAKPSISFGFGASTSLAKKDEPAKPAFSFGASTATEKKDEPAKPALSFGLGAVEKKDETAKPAFSFGLGAAEKKDEPSKPAFSFGLGANKKEDDTAKPAFAFGSSTTKDKKDDTAKPLLSFGLGSTVSSDKKDDTAKPAFSFGLSNTLEKKDETAKPVFSFGIGSTEKKDESAKPAFGFGASTATTEKKDESAKPVLSFGLGSGLSSDKKEEPAKTAFSFGASTTTDKKEEPPKTAFSFGTSTTADKKEESPKPTFSFGSQPSTVTTPALNFGLGGLTGKTTPTPDSSTPTGPFKFDMTKIGATGAPLGGAAPANSSTFSPVNSGSGFSFGASNTMGTKAPVLNGMSFPAPPQPQAVPAFKPSSTINMNFGSSGASSNNPQPSAIFGATTSHSPSPASIFGATSATPPSMNSAFGSGTPNMNMGMNQGMNSGMGQGFNMGMNQGMINQGMNQGMGQGFNMGMNQGMNQGMGGMSQINPMPGRRIARPRRRG